MEDINWETELLDKQYGIFENNIVAMWDLLRNKQEEMSKEDFAVFYRSVYEKYCATIPGINLAIVCWNLAFKVYWGQQWHKMYDESVAMYQREEAAQKRQDKIIEGYEALHKSDDLHV